MSGNQDASQDPMERLTGLLSAAQSWIPEARQEHFAALSQRLAEDAFRSLESIRSLDLGWLEDESKAAPSKLEDLAPVLQPLRESTKALFEGVVEQTKALGHGEARLGALRAWFEEYQVGHHAREQALMDDIASAEVLGDRWAMVGCLEEHIAGYRQAIAEFLLRTASLCAELAGIEAPAPAALLPADELKAQANHIALGNAEELVLLLMGITLREGEGEMVDPLIQGRSLARLVSFIQSPGYERLPQTVRDQVANLRGLCDPNTKQEAWNSAVGRTLNAILGQEAASESRIAA